MGNGRQLETMIITFSCAFITWAVWGCAAQFRNISYCCVYAVIASLQIRQIPYHGDFFFFIANNSRSDVFHLSCYKKIVQSRNSTNFHGCTDEDYWSMVLFWHLSICNLNFHSWYELVSLYINSVQHSFVSIYSLSINLGQWVVKMDTWKDARVK